jgi:hypothetical protein
MYSHNSWWDNNQRKAAEETDRICAGWDGSQRVWQHWGGFYSMYPVDPENPGAERESFWAS